MHSAYSYHDTLALSRKIDWQIEDVLGEGGIDFSKAFLPESLARVEPLTFLSDEERRTLNHIRGHSYLCLFGLVEEFILPFVLDHARARLTADDIEVRALLQFAAEEAKHIHLFKRFAEEFHKGFGTGCGVIGPAAAVAEEVLSHSQLGVALAILHIEWMTQRHYTDSVTGDDTIDDKFKSLLKHHWMEEAQHAKLDTLIVEAIAGRLSRADVQQGLEDYGHIGRVLDDGLRQQARLDLESFQEATSRELSALERMAFLEVQERSYRESFLEAGATHPKFLQTVSQLQAL